MMKRFTAYVVLVVVCMGMLGCDSGKPLPVPVSGTAKTTAGEPCVGALIVFHPSEKDRVNDAKPFSVVDDQGKFVLTTHALHDGAVPGDYNVTVVWAGGGGSSGTVQQDTSRLSLSSEGQSDDTTLPKMGTGVDQLSGKYSDPRNAKIKVTVNKDSNREVILDLEP